MEASVHRTLLTTYERDTMKRKEKKKGVDKEWFKAPLPFSFFLPFFPGAKISPISQAKFF
jgi:hypothetical protein